MCKAFIINNHKYAIPAMEVLCTGLDAAFPADEGKITVSTRIKTMPLSTGSSLVIERITLRTAESSEVPAWLAQKELGFFEREYKTLLTKNEDGRYSAVEDLSVLETGNLEYDDMVEISMFCLEAIRDGGNLAVYQLLTDITNPNVGAFFASKSFRQKQFVLGMIDLVLNPAKQTQIESMAKTISASAALQAVLNNIECTGGKKALVIPYDMLKRIQTAKLSEFVPMFQKLIMNKAMSLEQLDEALEAMRMMVKFRWLSASDLYSFFNVYQNTILAKGINLNSFLETIIKNAFLTSTEEPGHYAYRGTGYYAATRGMPISNLMNHYIDALSVLPVGRYPTNNIEVFHAITTRNSAIMEHRRPEEFTAVAESLRKLVWDSPDYEYHFRPMQTEDELFYVGERYNNCLPIYRDKIIDENAIVVCVYHKENGVLEKCPSVVFEVTPYLDIIQVKTYNDADVTDRSMLNMISDWKEAKRYLLSNGRTVYRDPESN